MSDNTITGLREELFATLRALRSKDDPIEVDRARAISQVAETIVATARAEIDFARATGAEVHSSLLSAPPPAPDALPAGIVGRTVHRIKG